MNLNVTGITSLSDGPFTDHTHNVEGSADNAVDGKSAIGQSKALGFKFCAVNNYRRDDKLQFLRISLYQRQPILSVRLHLRDPAKTFTPTRYYSRLGIVNVSVGNSSNVNDTRRQCGSSYQASQGQSPLFICFATGSYVWLTVRANYYLEVCEVEVYAGKEYTYLEDHLSVSLIQCCN